MILTELQRQLAYRVHVPKWALAPTSGAGAARHGGRVNRPGVPTLYLALESVTAIAEYQQVSSLLPPGTLVSYEVTAAPVADFRSGYDAACWAPIWEDFFCDWRELWFNQRIEPPSWVIGDEVLAAGAKGILFPSHLAQGGVNFALFTDALVAADALVVFDPDGTLPKNQDSWQ